MRARDKSAEQPTVAIIGTRGYPSFYGGFETAVRKIAPYLAEDGWVVRVYGRPGATRSDSSDIDSRVISTTTRGVNSTSLSTLTFGLTSAIHAFFHKPDVALVMNVANGYWLPLLKARGIPTVVNVDGIEWQREKWGKLAKAVFRWGAWMTAKFAGHLVFDAKAIESFWQREFGRGGTFIPYGGETSDALPLEPGLTSKSYALLVARFVPENSIIEFVEAAETISKAHDVVLVGSAPEGTPLHRRVADLAEGNDRVHWLGHVSDDRRLFALWQHAGAYFHGHSVGGTNPALVQAMTLGVSIVARDTVYNREVLGSAGMFCEATPDAIAASILEMIRDPKEFGMLAAERASTEYTWAGVCRLYADVLQGEIRAR